MRGWILILAAAIALVGAAASARAEPRIAIVVGVSSYEGAPLPNASRDARLVDVGLKSAGFRTFPLFNPTRQQLREAVSGLVREARAAGEGTTVAFYFAGHGLQADGENFLLPADAAPAEAGDTAAALRERGVAVQWVLDELARAQVSRLLLILDACRTAPRKTGNGRVRRDGLAPIARPPGEVKIVFSAEPGAPALDGPPGESGFFSRALSDFLKVPGLTVDEIFYQVARKVDADTGKHQQPHVQGFLPFILREVPLRRERSSRLGVEPARIEGPEDGFLLLRDTLKSQSLDAIRAAAQEGDGFAMYLLGLAHWDGVGGAAKDRNEVRRWMKSALAKGVGRAATSLGYLACCDTSSANWPDAVEWYRVGRDLGAAGSVRNLAVAYRDGNGVPKDLVESERLFLQAGEMGLAQAFDLAAWLHRRSDGPIDMKKGIELHERALNAGYLDAAVSLAEIYKYGISGVPRDAARAERYLTAAAGAGCMTCAVDLGYAYDAGLVGDEAGRAAKAIAAFRQAAEAGDSYGMLALGMRLFRDAKSPVAMASAYQWFDRAYRAGNAEAGGFLGMRLAKGEGVKADPERAAALLKEVLALEADPARSSSIFPANYWTFGRALASLHKEGKLAGASPAEAARLTARYGAPSDIIERFTVPIDCNGLALPYDLYLVNWDRPEPSTVVQNEWLHKTRGCEIPKRIMEAFATIYATARKENIAFTALASYFLATRPPGWAVPDGPNPAAGLDTAVLEEKVVLLLQGKNIYGDQIYTYLQLSLKSLYNLRAAMKAGTDFMPADFGTVLDAGKGDPSPELRAKMAKEHNMVDVPKPPQPPK